MLIVHCPATTIHLYTMIARGMEVEIAQNQKVRKFIGHNYGSEDLGNFTVIILFTS